MCVCAQSSILMALMIGGFVEAAESDAKDGAAFFSTLSNARCFSSKKPAFESGAALSLGKKTATAGTTSALPLKKYVQVTNAMHYGYCGSGVLIVVYGGQVDRAGRRL